MSASFDSPWWYRQVPRDFMSSPDVQVMTAEECGSYFFLLQCAWLGGDDCTLPNDPERLARLARVTQVSETVLRKFKTDKDGRLFNPRLLDEWKEAVKRSKDGKKAIAARWKKEHDGNTTVAQSKNESITTNTNTNTHTNKSKPVQTHAAISSSAEAHSGAPSTPTTPRESAARCAGELAKILGRDNLKPATLTAWAMQAEPLLAANEEKTIVAVMRWALVDSGDGFWRGRVFAMKNFVRSFNAIQKQFQSGQKRGETADPLAARCASLSTGHDFSATAKGDL
jgi:uncharacterized protein YdaU (DUF1376 family)